MFIVFSRRTDEFIKDYLKKKYSKQNIVWEGKLASLRRFKDDVKEVSHGYECGMNLDGFNDIKEGDEIEAYTMEEVPV